MNLKFLTNTTEHSKKRKTYIIYYILVKEKRWDRERKKKSIPFSHPFSISLSLFLISLSLPLYSVSEGGYEGGYEEVSEAANKAEDENQITNMLHKHSIYKKFYIPNPTHQ